MGLFEEEKEKAEAWLRLKWGKFSASQAFHLITGNTGEMFGTGATTYIQEVAREGYTMFNTDELVESYAMKMGKVNEAQSFGYIYQLLGFKGLVYHGGSDPIFKLYEGFDNPEFDGYFGASPDGTAPMSGGKYSFGLELKNPKQKTHWEYVRKLKDQWDLKEMSMEYYTQAQANILTFDTDLWLWASYNEYFPFKHRAKILEIKRDNDFIRDFRLKLKSAIRLRHNYIKEMEEMD